MDVTEIEPGLWRWTTRYGEWGQDVGCVYLETEDAVVLIDPLVPEEPAEAEAFWKELDEDVRSAGTPVHVLLTIFWHARSAKAIVERYGATLHVQTGGRAAIERRAGPGDATYRPGATLPGGVVAHRSTSRSEVIFWIPAHGALVLGDVFVGDGNYGLASPWLSADERKRLPDVVAPLLELPVRHLLVSHGEPVLGTGRKALAAAGA